MKKAGVYHFAVGIESWDKDIQESIGKNLNMEKLDKMINLSIDNNIMVTGFFMIGFLNETKEQAERTINYAVNSRLHMYAISKVTPFKGTKLYDMIKQSHNISNDSKDFNYIYGHTNISNMTNEELDKIHKNAYYRFYFKPRRILSIFRLYPNKLVLFKLALRFLKWDFSK